MTAQPAAEQPVARPRAIDWFFTILFWGALGSVLGGFDLVQRVARLFGPHPHEITVAAMQRALLGCFPLGGIRLLIERDSEVLPNTQYLLISNHQSMLDIPIIGGLLFSNYPKYISKKSLAKGIPGVSFNLRHGGNALIDRDSGKTAIDAIAELGREATRRKVSPTIFAEGTRSRNGNLGPFKPGGLSALLDAAPDLPVVVVSIDGAWKLAQWGYRPMPFGVDLHVHFAAPIERVSGDAQTLADRARAQIEADLRRWRA